MELTDRLKNHITASGTSQNQVSKSLGISGGALSAWLSGTYRGDNRRLSQSIENFLRKEQERRQSLKVPTVAIETYRQIHFAMDIASEEVDIAVICGHAGTGKTTALRDYVKQYGGIYILTDKTCSQYRLITLIADKLGITEKGSAALLTERIIHTLEDLDTLVVIDEADYLSDGSLEYLRQVVYDAGQTGLVLCGLPRLAASIQNVRNDHDQLLTRIGVLLHLDDIGREDMEKVIDSAWQGLASPVKKALISESSIRFRSSPSACLRTLAKMLTRLHSYLRRLKKDAPEVEDVKHVAHLVMRRH